MEETTTEQAWPEWDDTFAEHDARILFPDLYKGRNGARNNEPYDVDSGDRRNPIIGVPGNGGIQWSEGNKLIDDAYPDYTPPEPYDFEKAIAEWDSGTLHKPNLRGEGETASPGAVFESRPVSSSSKKRDDGAFSQAKFSDWNPPTRKDSIGMFYSIDSLGHHELTPSKQAISIHSNFPQHRVVIPRCPPPTYFSSNRQITHHLSRMVRRQRSRN